MSEHLLFFSGAAMHPERVRSTHPEARFLARARVVCTSSDVAPAYAAAVSDTTASAIVWGIVVRSDTSVSGMMVEAVTDEGAPLSVVVAERPLIGGDVESALEAALYWELPPAYTIRLREAAGIAAPEAEGGWESMQLGQQPPTS